MNQLCGKLGHADRRTGFVEYSRGLMLPIERQGSNALLRSRFAALRVRAAHQDWRRSERREEEWLLIDWPRASRSPSTTGVQPAGGHEAAHAGAYRHDALAH